MQEFTCHLRLLVDLLQHEVWVPALLNGVHCFGNRFRVTRDKAAIFHGAQFDTVRAEGDDFAILDADDLAGKGEDGGQVRGEACESITNADDETRTLLDGIKLVIVDTPNDKGIIALQIAVRQADGVDEIVTLVDVALDGVDTRLAIVL